MSFETNHGIKGNKMFKVCSLKGRQLLCAEHLFTNIQSVNL
jgi:hypothetical protein